LLVFLVVGVYGVAVLAVNYPRPAPTPTAVSKARIGAADWLLGHREEVLGEDNAILWSMVARSAALTRDPALRALVDDYLQRYMVPRTGDPQRQLFGLSYRPLSLGMEGLESIQDYQLFHLYALTCDPRLSALARVTAQQDPAFCPASQPLRPACTTHQLMGLRLAEEYGCMSRDATAATKVLLLDRIERQLYWDVRLVDTYIQRALMLTEERGPSGAGAPALQNILRMQVADGGWSRSQAILPLGGGKWFGITEGGLGIVEKRGQFHATAQVLLLYSLVEAGSVGRE
jgi:hypothetical protein